MRSPRSLAPDWIDKSLAAAAVLLLACVAAALARGWSHWSEIPTLVWVHLVTVLVALALAPIMLLRRRGDGLHRILGWIWVLALMVTAIASFGIRHSGSFSPIHLISIFVLIQTPLIVWRARRHDISGHRIAVRATTAGALILAGFFTFPFGRLLGRWLFA